MKILAFLLKENSIHERKKWVFEGFFSCEQEMDLTENFRSVTLTTKGTFPSGPEIKNENV